MRTTAPTSTPSGRRLIASALLWAVALSLYFLIAYGGSNWVASRRFHVGTWHYGWEKYIPFVPAMIVPYMSIDLFFFSPLLCQTHAELPNHVERLALAITAAAVCFLLFPFRMGTTHEHVGGIYGTLFVLLGGFDRPYNLVPSLHIALLTILWSIYSRHTGGILRLLVRGWFVVVAVSTLLTAQHHVIDVVTGLLLGLCCLYLVPDERTATAGKNFRVARRYAAAGGLLLALAWLLRPWGLILIWPAAALAILAAAYMSFGPRIFGKSNGRVPWHRRIILAPYFGGNRLTAAYLRRGSERWCQVAPKVWLGRRPSDAEAREIIALGVSAVLDLTAEYSEPAALLALSYKNLAMLDLTVPSLQALEEDAAFIQEHAGRGVYIHCALGYSRSVYFAAAWLLKTGLADSPQAAIAIIRELRPGIAIKPAAVAAV